MDAPALPINQFLVTEAQLRTRYNALAQQGSREYCLVALSLKHFSEYLHIVGQALYPRIILHFFQCISPLLGPEDCIAHIHFGYFNLLVRCEHSLEALHEIIRPFHFAIRDGMEECFGRRLYLAMGFYPLSTPEVDFFDARYFADLCRQGAHYHFIESNYDMYGLSYLDQMETFRKLESSVQRAIQQGDFKLYLQPKVNLTTGQVEGAEALVRWLDPERGMIPLKDFLPHIEENGFIRDLDSYLFNVACGYLDRWFNIHGKKINISFNLNRAYFNGDFFMPEYTGIFNRYHIPPECVCIELLESIVLDDFDRLGPLVREIYDFGFSCALDDFGSGFSSFGVLTSVRLSELKIDRSLFRNIENAKERALIKHIIDIAHDMGMVTVAEGIEAQAYADYLRDIGCDFIQGFLYYRPMPVEEFEARFITGTVAPQQ